MSFRDMVNSKTNTFNKKKEYEIWLKEELEQKNIKVFNESDESINVIKNAVDNSCTIGSYNTSVNYNEMLIKAHIYNQKNINLKNINLNCKFLCNRVKKELGLDCECKDIYVHNRYSGENIYTKTSVNLKWN